MTAVAPWLNATVYFADVDRLPRDVRLEVRTAGRLVVATAYEAVASYAFSYAQAARGTVPLLEDLFAKHQNLDQPWNAQPRQRWHVRPMSIGDLVALTLSDYPPKWWVCEAMGFRLLQEHERSRFTSHFYRHSRQKGGAHEAA